MREKSLRRILRLPVVAGRLQMGSFGRSVALLAGGTAFGQAIGVLVTPILARIYSPEDFGLVGVYGAILFLLSAGASLTYEQAIPVPKDDDTAADLMVLSVGLNLALAVVLAVVLPFAGPSLVVLAGVPALRSYLWILPASFALIGLYRTLSMWAVREKAFGCLSSTKASQSVVGAIASITLGLVGQRPLGLLVGDVLKQGWGVGRLAQLPWRRRREALFGGPRWQRIRSVAIRYSIMPRWALPSTLASNAATHLQVLVLGFFFGATTVGYWALGMRLLQIPVALIGTSIGDVFFSEAAPARDEGRLAPLTASVFRRLASIGLAPMLTVAVVGTPVFVTVLGAQWATAGLYSQWLAPWYLWVFVTSPLTRIFTVLERQRESFLFNTCLLLSRLMCLAAGGLVSKPLLAVALYGGSGGILWCWMCFYSLELADVKRIAAAGILAREGLFCAPLLIWLIGWRLVCTNPAYVTLAAAVGLGITLAARHGPQLTKKD